MTTAWSEHFTTTPGSRSDSLWRIDTRTEATREPQFVRKMRHQHNRAIGAR